MAMVADYGGGLSGSRCAATASGLVDTATYVDQRTYIDSLAVREWPEYRCLPAGNEPPGLDRRATDRGYGHSLV